MKNFWARNRSEQVSWRRMPLIATIVLVIVGGFMAATGRAQTNFATAQVIYGTSGTVTNSNAGFVPNDNPPSIAGFAPNAPLWYSWTAPQSGEVEMDTIGSFSQSVVTNSILGYQVVNVTVTNLETVTAPGVTNWGNSTVTYTTVQDSINQTVSTNDYPLDTVLAVFTGNSVSGLNQVAANDNLFPINNTPTPPQGATLTQTILGTSGDYENALTTPFPIVPPPPGEQGVLVENEFAPPYYGPSHLRFNAVAGTTYYIAVDTKANSTSFLSPTGLFPSTGTISLQWAYQSSGVFRFATEDFDGYSRLPLYQAASTESAVPAGNNGNDYISVISSYYPYNAQGVLVTVTRVAGSSGRCTVDYSTVDGTNLMALGTMPQNDLPGVQNVDYTPVHGQLVFDNYEMSKTILVPILGANSRNGPVVNNFQNVYFGMVLSNAQLDANEFGDLSQPRVDPTFSTAMIKVLNQSADPYGPDIVPFVYTNTILSLTNIMGTNTFVTNTISITNAAMALAPTNVLFGFEKANYRVPEDVNNSPVNNWTQVAIWVERFGTNGDAATLTYRINNQEGSDAPAQEEQNIFFPLQPGSDYAVPTPPTASPIRGQNSDFTLATGSISFPSGGGPASQLQEITFTVTNSTLTKFNKDFKIELYRTATLPNQGSKTGPWFAGEVAETTVTILFNDQHPPAGSVDELYNADFNNLMALPPTEVPSTIPSRDATPGVSGVVYSLAMLTNNEAMLAGNFVSYNGFLLNNGNPINNLVLVDTNGNLDSSFSPITGANDAVKSVAVTPAGQYIIAGDFTAFNNKLQSYVARINPDGSLDTSFTPAVNGPVESVVLQPDGKVLIGGSFTTVDNQQIYSLARLNADGSLDTSFNPGIILSGTVSAVAFLPGVANDIMIGGSFSVNGQPYANIARFTTNGLLDTTFSNVFAGADNTINAIGWQPDGRAVIGGAFTHFNGIPANYITRLNWDGSIDNNFFIGSGADDVVWNVNVQPDGTMYVGGQFSNINGTHRLGFARLYSNGTVDTTFMDTAYNQFAGLKKIFANDFAAVYSSGVQSDSNIIIGGDFYQVGGGQAYTNVCDSLDESFGIANSFFDPNLWVEPKTRDGVRDRYSVARLIGGSTPGPGNIQFQLPSYSANKSESLLTVGLVRTNGDLGPASANFSIIPGLAQSGRDYFYDSTPPLYWVASQFMFEPTRERSDGLSGLGGTLQDPYGLLLTLADLPLNNQSIATISVINNSQSSGNLNAQFQLANPSGADSFYLGGLNVPIGTALGASSAPFTVIDDSSQAGTFSFLSTNFFATNSTAIIPVIRSNGVSSIRVNMRAWATNGTAISGIDYRGVTNLLLQFGTGNNLTSNNYPVSILANGLISTNFVGKTVNLSLTSLGANNGIASFGISNATLTLVNPNFQGYLTFSATNYVANESGNFISFVVNRVSGSAGQISVQYATANGTATNGVNYVGSTNTLNWNSGDASPRTITVPILDTAAIGGSEQFSVHLFNPLNTGGPAPGLFYFATSPGSITNATLTITNNDSYGTLQFSQPSYLVNANGAFATISVVRTSGSSGKVSVNYNTSNGSNTTAGVDYTPTSGVLAFSNSQLTASFNVPVANTGVLLVSNYFFNVGLSNPTNATLGMPTNAIVNILSSSYNQSPGSSNGLFSATFNGNVLTLAYETNGQVLAGGDFTSVNGNPQNYIVRLNPDGSTDNGFSAGANGPVQSVVCQSDGNVLIGGTFSSADGLTRFNIARFMTNGFLDTTFNPGSGANGTVYALAEAFINGTRGIYVGGAFSAISSGPGNPTGASFGIARLNNNGTLDAGFNVGSGVDGTVDTIAVYPTNSTSAGKILIGGSFVHYNGFVVNGLVRLNSDGSIDTTFNAGNAATNGTVNAIAIQLDGRIIVGGNFGTFNNALAGNIVRLNADGSTDASFTVNVGQGANNGVNGIIIQADNRILVVGQFTGFNGVIRNGVTRLLVTGVTDPSINFGTGANGAVNAALVQTSTGIITLGGAFTMYDGAPAAHIVQIYGLSMTGSGTFEFSSGNYIVTETSIVAPITILRTGGTAGTNADGTGDVFVDFSTDTNLVAGSSNDTAIVNVNYLPLSAHVDFPAGESVETVNVPVLDNLNDVSASQWSVTMHLANPTPPATLLGPQSQSNAVLTIQNVNSAVSFANASTTVFENIPGGIANVDIIRQGNTNVTSSVQFFTTTNSATGLPGVDYISTNEVITFNPGVADVQAQVLIISNAALAKTVGMALTNIASTPFIFAPSNAILAVENNIGPPGELYFGSTNYIFNESAGSAVVTVVRTNGFTGDVSANFATLDGTALAGLNYVTNSASVQIRRNTSS
ncbi:MAG TPA: Calx-beta domain-containing protein, partial [Pseudomonadales bacterium]|nr:Calx-beta domain-containing protein [Pseudomonadales bacterium]